MNNVPVSTPDSPEKKAVKRIKRQLQELREAGFSDNEAYALLSLAIQISEKKD